MNFVKYLPQKEICVMDEAYWDHTDPKGLSFEEIDDPSSRHTAGLQADDWVDFKKEDVAKFSESFKHNSPSISEEPALEDKSSAFYEPARTSALESKMGVLSWKPPPTQYFMCTPDAHPQDMVRKIILGYPYSLEQYKARESKVALLDAAIKYQDGNAIITAVLFLKKTLKTALFNQEMTQRPQAIKHYISYLRSAQDYSTLIDFYSLLGRGSEAAMVAFSLALNTNSGEDKIQRLTNCLKSHFQSEPSLSFQSSQLNDYINLLKLQIHVEKEDSKMLRESKVLPTQFTAFPKTSSVINTSVIATLYYCCLYHFSLPENFVASPASIRKQQRLSDKQFLWTALATLSKQKLWSDVDSLFQSKSWLGGSRLKTTIGFDRVVDLLYRSQAPLNIISKYLALVEDKEKRLVLAKKYQCHHVVIDTLTALKDRQGLLSYLSQLPMPSKDAYYAQDCLKNPANKWKN